MAMLLLLDSNFRATFKFGSRQLLSVFSDAVQSGIRGAPDRVSLVSQVSYYLRTSPPASKVALIFGSFENILTGRRSAVQHFPMTVVRSEVESYVEMLRDLLRLHPSVSVYVLAPLFRRQPVWYEEVYGEMSNLFCSAVSHLNPVRVKVVPPVEVSAANLDPEGVHFDKVVQQLVVNQLLSSFVDGVFVNPTHYPVVDVIGYFFLYSLQKWIIPV
jgi:hypothetical protein